MQIRNEEGLLRPSPEANDVGEFRGGRGTVHFNIPQSDAVSEVESGPSPTQLAEVTGSEADSAVDASHYPGNTLNNPSEGCSNEPGGEAECLAEETQQQASTDRQADSV